MKTILFTAACMVVALQSAAQSKTEEVVFEYAINLYQEDRYAEAASSFAKFMKDFPASELKPRAHFNLALSYFHAKDIQKAKLAFQEILDEPYNERDENDLMEPYTLYKHHACRNLAMICIERKDFDDALKYIDMFDKKYPYQHFCGNEWAAYDNFKAIMLAKVYSGTGKVKEAIAVLAPHMFYNGLTTNEYVVKELVDVLERHYTAEQLREACDKAVASLRIIKSKNGSKAIITFFDTETEVEDLDFVSNGPADISRYRAILAKHELFVKFAKP